MPTDWRTIEEDREKYKAYLCSREWAMLRNAVRARCGGMCERCKVNEMECVHHLTYARKYDEPIEDLVGWCNACHEFTHGKSDVDPAAYIPPEVFSRESVLKVIDAMAAEGVTWSEMFSNLVHGREAADCMGRAWLVRAAEGEFAGSETDACDLQRLIDRRRQEQGIA
jgi:hypothetical protein